jgi:DNA-binding NarL/FixJ family response regulator
VDYLKMIKKQNLSIMTNSLSTAHQPVQSKTSKKTSFCERFTDSNHFKLTPAEYLLMGGVVSGLSNKQIAEKRAEQTGKPYSEKTVQVHLRSALNKVINGSKSEHEQIGITFNPSRKSKRTLATRLFLNHFDTLQQQKK